MKGSFCDINILIENTVELPKVAKTARPVFEIKYQVEDIEVTTTENIVDVKANLYIDTIYKAIDHTLRWNEQVVPVSGSLILEDKCTTDVCVENVTAKQFTGKLIQTNFYKQQIYICFKMFLGVEKDGKLVQIAFEEDEECGGTAIEEKLEPKKAHFKNNKNAKQRLLKELLQGHSEISSSSEILDTLQSLINEI